MGKHKIPANIQKIFMRILHHLTKMLSEIMDKITGKIIECIFFTLTLTYIFCSSLRNLNIYKNVYIQISQFNETIPFFS